MRPTLNTEKSARLELHDKQLREFLRDKSITVLPSGVSGMPTDGTAMPTSKTAIQRRVDRCSSVDALRRVKRLAE